MLISIIIPIFNVEQEIERCLLSVLTQDYSQLEIILIDDASPDNSLLRAERLIAQYPDHNVIIIQHDRNLGLSAARNSGINKATGEYLLFLDSDDALASADVISTLVRFITDYHKPDVIVGRYTIAENCAEKVEEIPCHVVRYLEGNDHIYHAYLDSTIDVIACGKLYSSVFLKQYQLDFEHGLYYEDNLWTFQWVQHAQCILFVPTVIFQYYPREGSITSTFTQKHMADLITILLRTYDSWQTMKWARRAETEVLLGFLIRERILQLYQTQTDDAFIMCQLKRLQAMKLPLFLGNKFSFLKQNLLLLLPTRWVHWWLRKRYRH